MTYKNLAELISGLLKYTRSVIQMHKVQEICKIFLITYD